MKAIILAAGKGSRLGRYGEHSPKGMLPFLGRPLIAWHLEVLGKVGVHEVIVVAGHCGEQINFPGVRCYFNRNYATTNMVESLMCARGEFTGDTLVAYADVLFDAHLGRLVADSPHDIAVAVDGDWREYWTFRYGTTECDLESLILDEEGRIGELGRPLEESAGLHHRYVGLIKFSARGIAEAQRLYDGKRARQEPWSPSGKSFAQGYMTDLLNELVRAGTDVRAVISRRGWMEFDTARDYENACLLAAEGGLRRFIDLGGA